MIKTDEDFEQTMFSTKSWEENIALPIFKRILTPSIIERNYSKAPDRTNYGLKRAAGAEHAF